MSDIALKVRGFKGIYAKRFAASKVNASKRRCLKAAMSIGAPLFKAGSPSSAHAVALASYKASSVKVAMDFTGNSLQRPPPYTRMDSTEKTNISFWTGMTIATLIGNQVMGIPVLLHAGALSRRRLLIKVNPNWRSLADLVGQDLQGNWHVIEAKARQDNPSARNWRKWKGQATTIASIQRAAPATRSVAFTRIAATYQAELVDPPEANGERVNIEFEGYPSGLVEAYYGPWRDVLSDSNLTVVRRDVRIRVRLVGYDPTDQEFIFVGLDEPSLSRVMDRVLPEPAREVEGEDYLLGRDGLYLFTSESPVLNERHTARRDGRGR